MDNNAPAPSSDTSAPLSASKQEETGDQSTVQSSPIVSQVQNVVPSAVVKNLAGKQVQQPSASLSNTAQDSTPVAPQPAPSSVTPAETPKVPSSVASQPGPTGAHTGKEQEPGAPTPPLPDVAKMSETEIQKEEVEVEKEIEALIKTSPEPDKPNIPEDAKKAGLEHAGEDTPMSVSSAGNIVLPMTFEDAMLTRKKYKWKDSIAWFAALIIYHWKRMHFKTKEKEI